MGTIFSETLTKLRNEAGFRTAYSFYHDSGGAQALKITYRNYLAIEQGKILPVFKRLVSLLSGLRVLNRSQAGNELVAAWLRTMAGDENYEKLLAPILNLKQGPVFTSPMHKAMKQTLAGNKYYLSVEQFNVIVANRDNYLCFLALANDESKWATKDLAKLMKLKPGAAVKALDALAGVKILKKSRDGRYKSPLCGKMVEFPHVSQLHPARFGKLLEYLTELSETGKLEWERFGTLRADSDALRDFLQLMHLNLSTAQSYAITKRTKKSALFAIRGSVTKLRDF